MMTVNLLQYTTFCLFRLYVYYSSLCSMLRNAKTDAARRWIKSLQYNWNQRIYSWKKKTALNVIFHHVFLHKVDHFKVMMTLFSPGIRCLWGDINIVTKTPADFFSLWLCVLFQQNIQGYLDADALARGNCATISHTTLLDWDQLTPPFWNSVWITQPLLQCSNLSRSGIRNILSG